jgi:Na+-driven multidrug efflux pump
LGRRSSALGARDESLREALAYSNIVFGGSIILWLLGSLTGILRGMGDMKSAARITVWRAVMALPLFCLLIFGWEPVPSLGIVGAAIAMLTYYMFGVVGMIVHLQSSRSAIHLRLSGLRPQRQLLQRILKVAALSSGQVLAASAALLATAAFVARFRC